MKLVIAGSRKLSEEQLDSVFADFTGTCHFVCEELGFEKITEVSTSW